jgi:uncharacterized protein (TIGR02301 family)
LFAAALSLASGDDEPVRRQVAADLAYVLGEIHALHRTCAGPNDGTWRARMEALVAAEAADDGFRRRLMKRFNSGYLEASATHVSCSSESLEAERRAEGEGARLARRLAGETGP